MNKENTIYGQLMQSIRNKIISGELQIGDKIESERAMSEKYGINRMTVRNALKHLENEGVLESIRGSGTYVRKKPYVDGKLTMDRLHGVLSLSTQIRQKGMKSSRILISMNRTIPTGTIRDVYPDENEIYEIIRLSLINDNPYALQKVYIPCSLFNDAERFDFEEGSLYDYMQDKGYRPKTVISYLRIEELPEEYLKIMRSRKEKKYMLFDYYAYDGDQKLIEYTISYHHPAYTKFTFETEINLGG